MSDGFERGSSGALINKENSDYLRYRDQVKELKERRELVSKVAALEARLSRLERLVSDGG